MEHTNDELFKFIPFRIHQADKPFSQQLFHPVGESGELLTLRHLISKSVPEVLGKYCLKNAMPSYCMYMV